MASDTPTTATHQQIAPGPSARVYARLLGAVYLLSVLGIFVGAGIATVYVNELLALSTAGQLVLFLLGLATATSAPTLAGRLIDGLMARLVPPPSERPGHLPAEPAGD